LLNLTNFRSIVSAMSTKFMFLWLLIR